MRARVILDTGPLVALLNTRDRHHRWATRQWEDIEPPLLTCESVISEACFLLMADPRGPRAVFEMISRHVVAVSFSLADHAARVTKLLKKYADVPISVADACLVRMSEELHGSAILTLDRDFRKYRRNGRQVIPLIIPGDRL